jgi:hypothetical protein
MGAVRAVLEQTRDARCDHAIQVHFRWIETSWDAAQKGRCRQASYNLSVMFGIQQIWRISGKTTSMTARQSEFGAVLNTASPQLDPSASNTTKFSWIRRRANFTTPAGAVLATDRTSGDTDIIAARVNYRCGGQVVAELRFFSRTP